MDPHIPYLRYSEVNCISFLLGPWKQRPSLAYLLISSDVFPAHGISVILLFKIFISKENFLTEVIYYLAMCVIYFSTFQPKAPKGKTVGQEKKVIHPYSRKAAQITREAHKQEKKEK